MSQAHWLALASISGLGGVTAHALLERFGDVESIFDAPAQELVTVPRVTESIAEQIHAAPLEQLQAELYALSEAEVDLLTWDDARFPANLRGLADAPLVLFLRGSLTPADQNAAALVGSRSADQAGMGFAHTLGYELALRGITIVSGLALGIDTAAHQGALEAEDGRTLAVLGSGIHVIHPRENAGLAEQIAQHGAILSELMPNAPPRGPQLMARDRIVSGLSRAVIVVQAGTKSGSLDTAAKARKQKRLVIAVPGSPGTDGLLRGGAIRLESEQPDYDSLAEQIYAHTNTADQQYPRQAPLL